MDHCSATTPLATFHCFANLPMELQIKIWELAIPRQRIIGLKVDVEKPVFNAYRIASVQGPCSTVPTILHVCNLARRIALGIFRLGFGEAAVNKSFYWNPAIDILHLNCASNWWKFLFADDLPFLSHEVQYLAMPLTPGLFAQVQQYSALERNGRFLRWIHRFKNLQIMSFIVPSFDYWAPDWSVDRDIYAHDPQLSNPACPRSMTFQEPSDRNCKIDAMGYSANEIVHDLEKTIHDFREAFDPAWSLPKFELLVIEHVTYEQDEFCIAPNR